MAELAPQLPTVPAIGAWAVSVPAIALSIAIVPVALRAVPARLPASEMGAETRFIRRNFVGKPHLEPLHHNLV